MPAESCKLARLFLSLYGPEIKEDPPGCIHCIHFRWVNCLAVKISVFIPLRP